LAQSCGPGATDCPPCEIQPIYEKQVRSLAQLEPAQQREVWEEAVKTGPAGKVTSKHVANKVKELTAPAPEPNPPSDSHSGFASSVPLRRTPFAPPTPPFALGPPLAGRGGAVAALRAVDLPCLVEGLVRSLVPLLPASAPPGPAPLALVHIGNRTPRKSLPPSRCDLQSLLQGFRYTDDREKLAEGRIVARYSLFSPIELGNKKGRAYVALPCSVGLREYLITLLSGRNYLR
jgi:hypothetical protein